MWDHTLSCFINTKSASKYLDQPLMQMVHGVERLIGRVIE